MCKFALILFGVHLYLYLTDNGIQQIKGFNILFLFTINFHYINGIFLIAIVNLTVLVSSMRRNTF